MATQSGHAGVVRLLLDNKADVNAADPVPFYATPCLKNTRLQTRSDQANHVVTLRDGTGFTCHFRK